MVCRVMRGQSATARLLDFVIFALTTSLSLRFAQSEGVWCFRLEARLRLSSLDPAMVF